MRLTTLLCAFLIAASPSFAQDRETLGYGRLFTNDFLGDTQDRWRTGSYSFSIVRGSDWGGDLASTPRPVLEYRLRSEIIAPGALNGLRGFTPILPVVAQRFLRVLIWWRSAHRPELQACKTGFMM